VSISRRRISPRRQSSQPRFSHRQKLKNHVGENATVCGQVASENTAVNSHGTPTLVNLDEPYPHQVFTVLIWGSDKAAVGPVPKAGRVCAKGTISLYRGVPEIVIHSSDDLYVPKLSNDSGSMTSPHVTCHRANASGELIINRGVDVPKLTMMHDFALSTEHIVLMDLPIVFRPDIALPATFRTAGAMTTAPGSECCAAMTHTAPSAGLTSRHATFFMFSTPLIRPRMMATLWCCNQPGIPSCGATTGRLVLTP
jgi:hypothetical protein